MSVRVCQDCERATDESGRFCPECGAAFAELARTSGRAASETPGAAGSLVGTTIDGQFRIESVIGGGAFGTVYRGVQLGLDRPVAVKVPTFEIAADPIMARRFAREARSAARVHHPGVVAIHAVGDLPDGRPYLAMQLVDGEPLDKALEGGPLPAVRALRIIRQIASALSETHAAQVVHRDLKPTNVMWRRDRNGDDQITLVDFGIAVCKPGNADATRLTADGLIGTPHYMSPEQAHGEQVDARADLYALGCILFELVTGKTPFDGSGFEVLLAHLGRPAPRPSTLNASVPSQVDDLVAALMQKSPDRRPQSADELVTHIDEALAVLDKRVTGDPGLRGLAANVMNRLDRPRRTLETRVDLPDEAPRVRRRVRVRSIALGLGAAALGATIAVVAIATFRGDHVAQAGPVPSSSPGAEPDPSSPVKTLYKDNGEMIVRARVPEPLLARREIHAHLDIKNKLGQPVVADEIVLTIADAKGAAKGLTAHPHGTGGEYYFHYTFATPGDYVLRVFPPSIDSSFEIPITVR